MLLSFAPQSAGQGNFLSEQMVTQRQEDVAAHHTRQNLGAVSSVKIIVSAPDEFSFQSRATAK